MLGGANITRQTRAYGQYVWHVGEAAATQALMGMAVAGAVKADSIA
jgi:hypothetical protein